MEFKVDKKISENITVCKTNLTINKYAVVFDMYGSTAVAGSQEENSTARPLQGRFYPVQWTEKEGEAYAGKTDDGVLFRVPAGEAAVGVR